MRHPLIGGERATVGHEPSQANVPGGGGWILAARVGWIVLTLLLLALTIVAIPRADALFQSICQPGTKCLGIQLAPADLQLLRQLGISPALLATYQVAWDVVTVLIDTLLAALIFWRRSHDRMALFCAYVLVLTGAATYTTLLDYGLRPLASFWYWPVGVLEVLGLTALLVFFMVFPRGVFLPRWTSWLVPITLLAEIHYVFFTNPLLAAKNGPYDFLAFTILIFITIGLQVYRYRRISTAIERQQTKWVVFGFTLAMLGYIVSFSLEHVFFSDQTVASPIFQVLITTTLSYSFLLLIPISIAIAILRSRLYDIDILINRTLVYGSLTAILASMYLAGVLGAQQLTHILTGQNTPQSPVVIVVTTLLIAALFQPLRRQLQRVIDRRFYRRKYDVEKTLANFGATLRQEIDLGDLRDHLLAAVQKTMEPASLSLWLRAPDDYDHRGQ
jgi:hypothetical protein